MNTKEIAERISKSKYCTHKELLKLAQAHIDLLAKLKEPTEEMIKAGEKYIYTDEMFKAMVAEMLKEQV
jgi:predicted transcriptional regulator